MKLAPKERKRDDPGTSAAVTVVSGSRSVYNLSSVLSSTDIPKEPGVANMRTYSWSVLVVLSTFMSLELIEAQTATPVGIFESHSDVGTVLHSGSVEYDAAKKTYTISGSGENMWSTADAFQFVWKKMAGDISLIADISFLTKTGNEHKKAVLMLRQSLDGDSVYADVALHASGLTLTAVPR